jgi:hypothetical protein
MFNGNNKGGQFMRCNSLYVVLIIAAVTIIPVTDNQVFAANIDESKLLVDALNRNPDIRLNALISLNNLLQSHKLGIDNKIKNVLYALIDEDLQNKVPFDKNKIGELAYDNELLSLAVKINDTTTLRYLVKNIIQKEARDALVSHGEDAFKYILLRLQQNMPESETDDLGLIRYFKAYFLKTGCERILSSDKKMMRKYIEKLPQKYKYPPANDPYYKGNVIGPSGIRDNILNLIAVCSEDKEWLPFLRDLASSDEYYVNYHEGYIPYARMSNEEREMIYLNKDERTKMESRASQGKLVKYYQIREKAKNIIDKMTK